MGVKCPPVHQSFVVSDGSLGPDNKSSEREEGEVWTVGDLQS